MLRVCLALSLCACVHRQPRRDAYDWMLLRQTCDAKRAQGDMSDPDGQCRASYVHDSKVAEHERRERSRITCVTFGDVVRCH